MSEVACVHGTVGEMIAADVSESTSTDAVVVEGRKMVPERREPSPTELSRNIAVPTASTAEAVAVAP